MARIAVLQHFWCENAGVFEKTLGELGHRLSYARLYEGQPVPALDSFDALIVMGGPMNVDETDKYAWLAPERELIAECVRQDRPVLGVCLGAQLIARAAGSRVYPKRPKEIGLFPVQLTADAKADPLFSLFANPQEVFQWHGDTFDLPPGAVLLAGSPRFAHQAFRIGRRVYALQFHLESTIDMVRNLARACADELAELPEEDHFEQYLPRLDAAIAAQNELAGKVAGRWAAMF